MKHELIESGWERDVGCIHTRNYDYSLEGSEIMWVRLPYSSREHDTLVFVAKSLPILLSSILPETRVHFCLSIHQIFFHTKSVF